MPHAHQLPTEPETDPVLGRRISVRPPDIDLIAGAIRISTLKRRAEHWREVPLPVETLRALELVHGLRGVRSKRASEPH